MAAECQIGKEMGFVMTVITMQDVHLMEVIVVELMLTQHIVLLVNVLTLILIHTQQQAI